MGTENYVEIEMKVYNILKYTKLLYKYKSTTTINESTLKDVNKDSKCSVSFIYDSSGLGTSLYEYKKAVLLMFLSRIGYCGNTISEEDVEECNHTLDVIMEEIKDDFTIRFDTIRFDI